MKNFNVNLAIKVSAVLLAVLVVVAEMVPAFKTALASLTGHHWSSKGVVITVVYILIGWLGKKKVSEETAFIWSVGSMLAILGFYLVLYPSHF